MRSYVFRALVEPGDRHGLVVSFPDAPEANTQGSSIDDAQAMAEEALGLALPTCPARGLPLPKPRARGRELVPIAVAPDVAAQLAVLKAFAEARMSKVERPPARQGREGGAKHPRSAAPDQLPTLMATLRVLDRQLIVGMEEAA